MINLHEKFYNLSADPFRLSSDYRFSFAHKSYSNAISYLKFALYSEEGFIVITGRPGTGKTTLINQVISELDTRKYEVATLVTTQYESHDLLNMIAASFNLDTNAESKSSSMLTLERFLQRKHSEGKRVLLIVDEAQGLKKDAVEELRQLSNLNIDGKPLLQIFLVGQEEFRDLIESPGLEQLRQRVVASSHMEPLTDTETIDYVTHRLKHAGWKGDPAIPRSVVLMAHHFSGGVPRIINLICGRLLLHGYIEQKHELDVEDMKSVLEELSEELLVIDNNASFNELLEKIEFAGSEYLSSGYEDEHTATEVAVEDDVEAVADETVALNEVDDVTTVNGRRFTGGAVSMTTGNTARQMDVPDWQLPGESSPADIDQEPADGFIPPVDMAPEEHEPETGEENDTDLTDRIIPPVNSQGEKRVFPVYTVAAILTGVLAISLLAAALFKDIESPAPEVASVDTKVDIEDATPVPVKQPDEQPGVLILPAKDKIKRNIKKQQDAISIINSLDFTDYENRQVASAGTKKALDSDHFAKLETGHSSATSSGLKQQNAPTRSENRTRSAGSEMVGVTGSNSLGLSEEQQPIVHQHANLQGVDGLGAEKQRQYIFEGVWVSKSDLVDFLPADKVYCKDYVRFVSCWRVPEYTTSAKGSFKRTVESRLSGFTDKGAFTVTSKIRTTQLPDKSKPKTQAPVLDSADTTITKSKRCVFIDHNFISCSGENGHIERYSRLAHN